MQRPKGIGRSPMEQDKPGTGTGVSLAAVVRRPVPPTRVTSLVLKQSLISMMSRVMEPETVTSFAKVLSRG